MEIIEWAFRLTARVNALADQARQFFERDRSQGLPPQRVENIRRILAAIDDAEDLNELETLPGWRLHKLRGDR